MQQSNMLYACPYNSDDDASHHIDVHTLPYSDNNTDRHCDNNTDSNYYATELCRIFLPSGHAAKDFESYVLRPVSVYRGPMLQCDYHYRDNNTFSYLDNNTFDHSHHNSMHNNDTVHLRGLFLPVWLAAEALS